MKSPELVQVDAGNVDGLGFFCYKSARRAPGYACKREWLEQLFREGLRLRLALESGRPVGFIEYIPAAYAWRSVHAPAFTVVHCLWVVGRAKNKGYGSALLRSCVEDARASGLAGVAANSGKRVWLPGEKLFLAHGLETVDQAPPSFALQALRFGDAAAPSFPTDWEARSRAFGPGLTVLASDRCPCVANGVAKALEKANEISLQTQVVNLTTAMHVRTLAPTPYGICVLVLDGKLLSYFFTWPKV